MTPLWEIDHNYYCCEGNYFAPLSKAHEDFECWEDFIGEWAFYSNPVYLNMNLIWRWDWVIVEDDEERDGTPVPPYHELRLYFMGQRKAHGHSIHVRVTKDDEPAVREYLKPFAEYMRTLWEDI